MVTSRNPNASILAAMLESVFSPPSDEQRVASAVEEIQKFLATKPTPDQIAYVRSGLCNKPNCVSCDAVRKTLDDYANPQPSEAEVERLKAAIAAGLATAGNGRVDDAILAAWKATYKRP